MPFTTITEFSSYDDASGAQMTMSHPACGVMALSFVCGEVRTYGVQPAKCFGNRARAQRDWAIKKMKAEFWPKVQALGPDWMARHKELYEVA
jgi:hypothetical protein